MDESIKSKRIGSILILLSCTVPTSVHFDSLLLVEIRGGRTLTFLSILMILIGRSLTDISMIFQQTGVYISIHLFSCNYVCKKQYRIKDLILGGLCLLTLNTNILFYLILYSDIIFKRYVDILQTLSYLFSIIFHYIAIDYICLGFN